LKSLNAAGLSRNPSVSACTCPAGTARRLRAAPQASPPAAVLPSVAPAAPAVATRRGAVAEAALRHAQAVAAVRQCAAAARRYGAAVEAVSAPPVPD
jgi:hypothetical protein